MRFRASGVSPKLPTIVGHAHRLPGLELAGGAPALQPVILQRL